MRTLGQSSGHTRQEVEWMPAFSARITKHVGHIIGSHRYPAGRHTLFQIGDGACQTTFAPPQSSHLASGCSGSIGPTRRWIAIGTSASSFSAAGITKSIFISIRLVVRPCRWVSLVVMHRVYFCVIRFSVPTVIEAHEKPSGESPFAASIALALRAVVADA